jgi:pyruvate dehydrogenase E1 component
MNENYAQPNLPLEAHEGVIRGCYHFGRYGHGEKPMTLLGSGAILTEVIKAAHELSGQGFAVDVISVTSWSELARDGMGNGESSWLTQVLAKTQGPIIAATDYVRAVPETVREFVPEGRKFKTLGTDGFGRSDTRAALRDFFGVDARTIEKTAKSF